MIKQLLRSPLFFDGAFGTYYNQISGGHALSEYANVNEPETVIKIHRQYIEAGAHAIKTNTFCANSQFFGDPKEIKAVIKSGFEIACSAAAGRDVQVFADIGGIHAQDCPAEQEYLKLAGIFIACGASHFIFETQPELRALLPALAHIRENTPESVVLVSFAVSQEGYTSQGLYYKNLLAEAAASDCIDIVGLNCSCGPGHMHRLFKNLDLPGKPLSAMPNAGYPSSLNGRFEYQDNAAYFSDRLLDIHNLGVQVLGGCCGTTPAHIRQTVRRIGIRAGIPAEKISARPQPETQKKPVNRLEESIASGRTVIAVELEAPLTPDSSDLIESARKAALAGADAVTIADSPLARTRADSMMSAALVRRETGMDVIPHLSCRDRNHVGIQSALIAGKMEGIQNIFAVTGDPIPQQERDARRGVYHFNATGLVSFIRHLNAEVFHDSPFFIGAALNPGATQFAAELNRARQKAAAGAQFFLTQPVFTQDAVRNIKEAKRALQCAVLTGILPVAGLKNALFLNNEVPGIQIPQSLIGSLADCSPGEARTVSLSFCMDIVRQTYGSCSGYYIMTPLRRIDLVCELIKGIRRINK